MIYDVLVKQLTAFKNVIAVSYTHLDVYKRQVDIPIRPLISARTASNYKISKLLSQILKHKIKFQAKYRTHDTTKKHTTNQKNKQKYKIIFFRHLKFVQKY